MAPFEKSNLKKIINALDNLPLVSGIPEGICEMLRQAESTIAIQLANEYLAKNDEEKKAIGAKIIDAIGLEEEENVNLVLPLLGAENPLIRWQIVQSITQTKSFLEKGGLIVDAIINILLEDKSPMVRVEAASMLGYCKSTSQIITALEYARDNDFESDDGYVVSHIAADSLKRIKERFVEIRKTQK